MCKAKLDPAQLEELVRRATESDRLYFDRHPHRSHRIRRSHIAEILQLEFSTGEPHPTPPGHAWFSVIRKICASARGRLFVLNRADAEVDLPEEICREAYEQTPGTREIEEKIRSTMRGGRS